MLVKTVKLKDVMKDLKEIKNGMDKREIIVFGSVIKNFAIRKESDIDIAVKFSKEIDKKQAILMLKKLIAFLSDEKIDIVVINFASFSLLYDIYTQGKLIFYKNKYEFYKDAFMVLKQYEDWKNIARYFEKREIKKVSENAPEHAQKT